MVPIGRKKGVGAAMGYQNAELSGLAGQGARLLALDDRGSLGWETVGQGVLSVKTAKGQERRGASRCRRPDEAYGEFGGGVVVEEVALPKLHM